MEGDRVDNGGMGIKYWVVREEYKEQYNTYINCTYLIHLLEVILMDSIVSHLVNSTISRFFQPSNYELLIPTLILFITLYSLEITYSLRPQTGVPFVHFSPSANKSPGSLLP